MNLSVRMVFQVDHKRFYNLYTLVQLYILVHSVGVVQNVHLASPKYIYTAVHSTARLYRIQKPDDDKPVVTGGRSLSNNRRELSEYIFWILASTAGTYVDVVDFQCTIIFIYNYYAHPISMYVCSSV